MGDKTLHIDIETYSSIDITKAGVYRYVESIDFEILLISYAYGDRDIKLIDLTKGDIIPTDFWLALFDKSIKKYAHNAAFERICFNKHFGIKLPIDQWYCTAVLASSCGLPLSLAKVSSALELGDHGKLSTGRALIKKFCMPQKRNLIRVLPEDAPEDWKRFCEYCIQDVEAERRIHLLIGHYEQCSIEREMYILDQIINDRGVLVDINFAKSATLLHKGHKEEILNELKEITGLVNPNSPAQLKAWLSKSMGIPITTLDKNKIGPLVEQAGAGLAGEVLKLRSMASKTSIQKYISMVRSACEDQRIRGMFQFLGAGRTGRWAGRIVQAHNLPRNYIEPLDFWRSLVFNRDIDTIKMFTNDVSLILSQLIRTAFIAPTGKTFGVADFSAIEARVIAWVSGEQWRLKVFNTHGKIYEASAASMFNVPIESITKGSPLRDRGKVAELALGFQGGHKAIARMGGSKMGLTVSEMKNIVEVWRRKNKNVVAMWSDVSNLAIKAVKTNKRQNYVKGIYFEKDGGNLFIGLPSGRRLCYANVRISIGKFNNSVIEFSGVDQTRGTFSKQDTYGGKLTENIVQAIARDLLAHAMIQTHKAGYKIVLHVHDEQVVELDEDGADSQLEDVCDIMGRGPAWSQGLPLNADGYISKYYKKD